MLQALNTGHDGSLTTVHANSPADALRRVETLALMAGVGLPHGAVREQVASALELVVHQARLGDGARVVESVTEVVRVAGGAGTRDLYCRGGELRRPGAGAARDPDRRAGGWILSAASLLAFLAAAAGLGACVELGAPLPAALAERGPRLARSAGRARRRAGPARPRGPRTRARPSGGGCCSPARSLRSCSARRSPARSRGCCSRRPGRGAWRACSRHGAGATGAPSTRASRRWRWRWRTRSAAAIRCAARSRRRRAASTARPVTSCAAPRASSPPGPPPTRRSRACAHGRRSARLDALVAACLLQRRAGGDLARLLRESARAMEDQSRLEDEVKAATAQARFTGLIVVLLPLGGGAARGAGQPRLVRRAVEQLPHGLARRHRGRPAGHGGGADAPARTGALVIAAALAFLAAASAIAGLALLRAGAGPAAGEPGRAAAAAARRWPAGVRAGPGRGPPT